MPAYINFTLSSKYFVNKIKFVNVNKICEVGFILYNSLKIRITLKWPTGIKIVLLNEVNKLYCVLQISAVVSYPTNRVHSFPQVH